MPVTRIAIDCGFSDGAHFSRDFASVYKSSPTTFRRGARSSRLVDAATVATTTLAD
jgi:transcriptional regulator GlxA family with amidase domain